MPTGHGAHPPTVFVVDHDAAVRDALSVTLRASEFGVRSFASGGAFLAALPLAPPGCLLVELDLADMPGTDLIARLRDRRIWLPAVLMSARLRMPDIETLAGAGIGDVLPKPFGRDELLDRVRHVLGEPRSTQGIGGTT